MEQSGHPASCNSELVFETTDSHKTPRREDQPITRLFLYNNNMNNHAVTGFKPTIPAMKDSMHLKTYGNCDKHCHISSNPI